MTASPVTPPRYPFSAVVVFGGGAIALAALGGSLFSVVRTHAEGLLDVSAEADSAPTGPPPNAVLFDSVASATDADMHDGVWFLLDKRISRVHRLIDGNSQWSAFGRPGDGPGELRRPAALVVHGDTIVVATPSRLQLYWPDGSYIGGREVEPPRICRHAQLGEMAARLNDVASSPEGLLLLFTCTTGRARGGVFLEIGEASYRPVVQGPTDASDYLWDPWHDMSVLATHPRGLVFGHPEDDCLGVFGLGGARLDSSCHARLDRVPVSTATALAEQVRAEFEGASAQIRIPQRYPPFDRVFVRSDRALFYRMPVPTAPSGVAEVQMTYRLAKYDGWEWAIPAIPAADNVFVSDDGAVLAAWDDMHGTLIAFYSVDDYER